MKMDIWEGIAPKWCHPTRLYDQKSLGLHTIPSSELRSGYIWFFSSLSRAKVQIPRLLLSGHPTVTLEKWLVSLGLKVVIPISAGRLVKDYSVRMFHSHFGQAADQENFQCVFFCAYTCNNTRHTGSVLWF